MELDERFRRPRYTLRKPLWRSELRIYDHQPELVFRFQLHQLYGTDAYTKLLEIDGPGIVRYLSSFVVRDHLNDETLGTIQNRDESVFTNDHWTIFDPHGSIIGQAIARESGLLQHLLPLTPKTYAITGHQSRVATLHKSPGSRAWSLTIRDASLDTTNAAFDQRLVIALAALLASIAGRGGAAGGGAGG